LKETLENGGLKVEILRSAVKPEMREDWVNSKVDKLVKSPKQLTG